MKKTTKKSTKPVAASKKPAVQVKAQTIDIRGAVEKHGGSRRANCAAEVYDLNGYKLIVYKDKITVRPKNVLSGTKYDGKYETQERESLDYITYASHKDVEHLVKHLARKEFTITSRKNEVPRGKSKKAEMTDGAAVAKAIVKPAKPVVRREKPNAAHLLESSGWLFEGKKWKKRGFEIKLTPNRLIVYPKGILSLLHYDKTYGTGQAGYDFVKVNQKTPIEDIQYLLTYLDEHDSPKEKKEKAKAVHASRKSKSKGGQEKKTYCTGCPFTASETSRNCEHMRVNESDGNEYCSNEEHWNSWYCRNSERKAFEGHESTFPHQGWYACKLSGEKCPYSYATLLGEGYRNAPVVGIPADAPSLALIHHMKGHRECPNYKEGRLDEYKRLVNKASERPKVEVAAEDKVESEEATPEPAKKVRRKTGARKSKVSKK